MRSKKGTQVKIRKIKHRTETWYTSVGNGQYDIPHKRKVPYFIVEVDEEELTMLIDKEKEKLK